MRCEFFFLRKRRKRRERRKRRKRQQRSRVSPFFVISAVSVVPVVFVVFVVSVVSVVFVVFAFFVIFVVPASLPPPKKNRSLPKRKLRKGYYLRFFTLMAVIFSRKPPSFEKLSHTRSMYFVVSDIACLISMITIFAIVLSGRLSASSIKYFGSLCSTANLAIVDASSE